MREMKEKSFTLAIIFAAVWLMMGGCKTITNDPNVVVLFTDDQRFNTIHSLGIDEIQTPQMDRLVDMGFSFTHAHIMGGTSGAVCMPSRAMLMTGKSLFHLEMQGAMIPDDHIMMPEQFQDAGYYTFGTGKWHNGKQSFARAFQNGGHIFFGGMSDHDKVPVFDFDPSGKYPEDKKYIADGFSSELFADEAIGFLESYNEEAPYFLYVAFTAPHDPRMAPDAFEALYPREKINVPVNFLPEHPFNNGEMKVRDEQLAPWPRTPEIIKDHIGGYYAMITHLDVQIGRILDAIEKTGKAANTIIVMAGDNGLAVGQHGLLGKQNIYEHSVRVPFIISGPGIPEKKKSDALVYLNDIYPTLCELVGLKPPDGIFGKSLVPVLNGKKSQFRDEIFYAYRHFQRGLRTDDGWKLILYNVHNKDTIQLFNLNEDPWETRNLAADPSYAKKIEVLKKQLNAQMRESGDTLDLEKENWGKEKVFIPELTVSHLAVGKTVTLHTEYSPKYTGGGVGGLVDGHHGMLEVQHDAWQGYEALDLDAIIDMGAPTTIEKISARFLQAVGSWVFLPQQVEYLVSHDGTTWNTMAVLSYEASQQTVRVVKHDFDISFDPVTVRYIRVKAENMDECPDWHAGAGGQAWIFIDEIVVK